MGTRLNAAVASLAALGAVLLTAACSGEESEGVATAGGESAEETSAAVEADPDAQALEFAECMRENGIDMPDPQAGLEGMLEAASSGSEDYTEEELTAAFAACEDLLPTYEDEIAAEIDEEAMLEYTGCLRENGVDISDDLEDADLEDIDPEVFDAAVEACSHIFNGADG